MPHFRYARTYRGPLRAVIFDWAGTTVDHGSIAPAQSFVEVFRRHVVAISTAQARAPMGMQKREHLRAILDMPAVAEAWRAAHGKESDDADLDQLYDDFLPVQIDCVARYAAPVPGLLETVAAMRERGMKIGSNTGYGRQIMEALTPAAAEAGFAPDCMVCADDVEVHRPAPWMALRCAERMNVSPIASLVKVDDTLPGVEEGLNAGMWSIGVTETGNEFGLSVEELASLDPTDRAARRAAAERRLAQAGAHYVIDGVQQLIPCLDDIERRLARGETP